MLLRVDRVVLSTVLLLGFMNINDVKARIIRRDNFAIDGSKVPEISDEYELDDKDLEEELLTNEEVRGDDSSRSGLAFQMPIAVAVLASLTLLICCFCCLRCAVTFDNLKRSQFYGGLKRRNAAEIARMLNLNEPIKK